MSTKECDFLIISRTKLQLSLLVRTMGEYKIKDLESLTGIKAHTIRIWEKRYNLLEPNRTDSNLRLYTDRDLQDILLVNLLNRNGYKISKIADLSRSERVSRVEKIQVYDSPDLGINKLIYALVEIDEVVFEETIEKLIEEHGLEVTFNDYLVPFLDRIGIMWISDTISVAQEHFISMLVRQRMIVEISKVKSIVNNYERTALLYLPENEWHEIGLLYYHYVLKKHGWRIFYLGQSTTTAGVKELCDKKNIDLVVSAWVSGFDTELALGHYNEVRSFYKGKMAIGGSQSILFEGLDVTRITRLRDVEQLV